ncbi:MAG: QacE family quaternary ammonium compound efflux SMR transporter [Isosphaera sp.]|nr:QacE family quaternary ammonium compound efflux SMR transporter [Isosphaera sp.]
MAWVYLFCAGLFEVGWLIGLKASDGFSRFWPSALTLLSMGLSMGLLGLAVRTLPMGTAYAVWTGVGAAGGVLAGVALYGDPATPVRLGCVALILAGIVGLKLAG